MSGTLGPKLREGDRQVPEGLYGIESLNPNSLFHLMGCGTVQVRKSLFQEFQLTPERVFRSKTHHALNQNCEWTHWPYFRSVIDYSAKR